MKQYKPARATGGSVVSCSVKSLLGFDAFPFLADTFLGLGSSSSSDKSPARGSSSSNSEIKQNTSSDASMLFSGVVYTRKLLVFCHTGHLLYLTVACFNCLKEVSILQR